MGVSHGPQGLFQPAVHDDKARTEHIPYRACLYHPPPQASLRQQARCVAAWETSVAGMGLTVSPGSPHETAVPARSQQAQSSQRCHSVPEENSG